VRSKNRFPRPSAHGLRRALTAFIAALLVASGLPGRGVARAQTGAPAAAPAGRAKLEFVPGEVLVRFREDAAVADASKTAVRLSRKDGGVIYSDVERFGGSELVEGLRLARVPSEETLDAVAALNARPDVLYAEPNYIWRASATPNDPRFGDQYAHQRIRTPQAWDITTGSNGVVVAVLDGGVDLGHPDLQANAWTNPGEVPGNGQDDDVNGFVDDVNGWDFANNDRTVFDGEEGDDHGTHVAGIIGARGNNGAGVSGVNWQVSIMSVKVLGGDGGGATSTIINGYNYVRVLKGRGINVRVTNNSYGGAGFSQSAFNAIQALGNADILFVAAAGNDAVDNFGTPHFPSSYELPNVLAVASTTSADGLSGFSNFGARVVSMGAPGSGILSTVPSAAYANFNGTSMSSPQVAGAAALVLSVNATIPVRNLRGVLAYTGDVLPTLLNRTTTGRRLNAHAAVTRALENDRTAPAAPSGLSVSGRNGRAVTLRWTAPGDDGNSGTAADYDFLFVYPDNRRVVMPTTLLPAAAGTTQTAVVNIPFRNLTGSIELRAFDDSGNTSVASVPVTATQSAATDPYTVALGAPESVSSGGTALPELVGDDRFKDAHQLPFSFPYFGQNRSSVNVSSNGALYFTPIPRDGVDGLDARGTVVGLNGQAMIAGMWDDIRTDRSNGGVFVVQPDSTRVIFRWQGVTFNTPLGGGQTRGEQPINFEIELRSNGVIVMRYGSGQSAPTNTRLLPVVGISGGEPDAYVVASHTSENALKNLTNAQTVTFTPRPAVTEPAVIQFATTTFSGLERDGTAGVLITRTGDLDTTQTVSYQTTGGTATAGSDYVVSAGNITLPRGVARAVLAVRINNDSNIEPNETVGVQLTSSPTGATLGANTAATLTIVDDDNFPANTVNIAGEALRTVAEGAGQIDITVTRAGNLSQAASVAYHTSDGGATSLRDYTFASGTLNFAAGDATETFSVPITEDFYDEDPAERFSVSLTDPVGTAVGPESSIQVAIQDDDAAGLTTNPSDDPTHFVEQHYNDFLNRVGGGGIAFWANGIAACGGNTACRDVKRIDTSAAFFLSIEFQETGYLVYRFYKAAHGDINPPAVPVPVRFAEFMRDTQEIGRGVVVNSPGWPAKLEANKQAFALAFVNRGRFKTAHPVALTPAQFVDALNANAGNVLSANERQAAINEFGGAATSADVNARARALRRVAEDQNLRDNEFRKAFVLMQYFGYLRRNPDDGGARSFAGWQGWLDKLNQFGGNYQAAEMVKAFIISIEYRQRFGR